MILIFLHLQRALSSSESEEDSSSSNSVASTTEKPTDTEAENVKANGITDSDKSGDDANKVCRFYFKYYTCLITIFNHLFVQPKPPSNKLTEENIPKKRWKSSQDLPPIDDNIHVTKTVKELLAEARTCGIYFHLKCLYFTVKIGKNCFNLLF